MKINDGLYRLCGVVDKKDFAWVPHTEHKLIDYRIELPIYRLWVEINGEVIEFTHPVDQGLDYLRGKILDHVNKKKNRRSVAKVISAV